ncbi:MAG: hypothetical protein JW816_00595 [Candidatus Buchananbacteria bacterium]|nr:hypothetical protein [Candidatus Buchananbacteria bacterium]
MAGKSFEPLKNLEKRILPSVVTFKADWRKVIKEVDKFGLSTISLFVTATTYHERQKIYKELVKTKIKTIPHIHINQDMQESEMDFLVKHYKAECFSVHYQFLSNFKRSKYFKKMFVETNEFESRIKSRRLLAATGGICVDLSHMDTYIAKDKNYYYYCLRLARQYYVGCNHLSAGQVDGIAPHVVKHLSDFDYLLKLPSYCFSKYICFELTNSIAQQLQFKQYLVKLLSVRHK